MTDCIRTTNLSTSACWASVLMAGVLGAASTVATAGWGIPGLDSVIDTVKSTSASTMDSLGMGSTEDENGVREDSVAGAAVEGAAVCGGLAVLFGASGSTTGMAAAACGTGNAVVTDLANSGRKDYAQKYSVITQDMAASESEITRIQSDTKANTKQAASSEREIKQLIDRKQSDQQFLSKADALRKELDSRIGTTRRSKSVAQDKVHIIDGQIAELDEIIKGSPSVKDIETTRVALVDQRKRLTKAIESGNNVERDLVAQKQQLDSEIIKRG